VGRRAIKRIKGIIERCSILDSSRRVFEKADEILPACEGRRQFWMVDEDGGHFAASRVTRQYQEEARQLCRQFYRTRFEWANATWPSWRALVSSLTGKSQRLESEMSTLETAVTEVLRRDPMYGQGWYRISFSPRDARLTEGPMADFEVYMRLSVLEKARAFQREKPLYLGTWSSLNQRDEVEGKFWSYCSEFWASTGYSEEEARLLLWEKGRREQRKFERLAKAMAAAKEAREEAGRERIPEEVRLLVWERDGGRCVKCGSTEDLEFDHIIPVSRGGSNTERNLQILCTTCNRRKKDRIG